MGARGPHGLWFPCTQRPRALPLSLVADVRSALRAAGRTPCVVREWVTSSKSFKNSLTSPWTLQKVPVL